MTPLTRVCACTVALALGVPPAALARSQDARTRSAARAEAARLLARLALPAGSVSSRLEPGGDGGFLASAAVEDEHRPEVVDAGAWRAVAGTPAQALNFIREHAPTGVLPYLSYPPKASDSTGQLVLRWPPTPGRIAERFVSVRAAQLPGVATGLRVDAEVVWVRARLKIPPDARLLRVTAETDLYRTHARRHTVTVQSLERIAAATRKLNSLRVKRPTLFEPDFARPYGYTVLTFYRHAADRRPVATSTVPLGGGCHCVTLAVKRRDQPPLAGGGLALAERLAHVLHVNLALRRTARTFRTG
jgi:hypothetical protein